MAIPMDWLAIAVDWLHPYANWPPLSVKLAYKEGKKSAFSNQFSPLGTFKSPACSAFYLTATPPPFSGNLPTHHLLPCLQLPFAMVRGNKQIQCPDCTTMVSHQKDLKRHMILHAKLQRWYACPDCPVRLLQKSNLETHRAKHHTGNEKYKCTDSRNCTWGGISQGVLTKHRRKYHGNVPPSGDIVQPIPDGSSYERETTAESSGSSSSYDFEAPTGGGLNPGETFMDRFIASSFPNEGAGFNRPMTPQAPETERNILWTSPTTGFQHGNVCYSPEAKQLYPAASTGSLLDDGLDFIPFLEGHPTPGDDGLIDAVPYPDAGNAGSLGSTPDAMGNTITFNAPAPAHAPFGYQYTLPPINPAPPRLYVPAMMYPGSHQPSSSDVSNIGMSQQDIVYGSIHTYGQGPPIPDASTRTSSNGYSEYVPGPSRSRMYYVDDQGQYRYG
ncbi:uncharacterized protein EV420DRAFT_1636574 [Desarmillaria tabescens]|uniref:C2H2-type domain-containing protein n=1 Tax=Armillaria tabescens TaxID=1929756 RepID=A0AA39TXF5_ARMTA|nr:uncharacterized protein EV420DRAFT_1636574 [Desarmillaria tabescens]KAK0466004.1 hypothetical protein EV420DRAFT_1636574 [Desarmillaria tabescens]